MNDQVVSANAVVGDSTPMASAADVARSSYFRLGLFGDTRSGKTMYLTALFSSANDGRLPDGINLLPKPGASASHLTSRLAMVRAGEWPPGDLDTEPIELLLYYRGQTFDLRTQDFKGGDFGKLSEPETKEQFTRFMRRTFADCSAYVFLIDPGPFKDADQNLIPGEDSVPAQRIRLEISNAIGVSLAALQRSGLRGHWFHKPVALVFTKSDKHPDAAADPEAFARKHLPTACRYLEQYAPKRHGFFAVSSTGTFSGSENPETPPPRPLQPEKLTEPLIWCIKQHLGRRRWIWGILAVCVLVVLAAWWSYLFFLHGSQFSRIGREIPRAHTNDLPGLFQEATDMADSWFVAITHPFTGERVRQEVVGEAHRRLQADIEKHLDSEKRLRDVDSYRQCEPKVSKFVEDYRATNEAGTLGQRIKHQRNHLSLVTANHILELAREGKETLVENELRQYGIVATPEGDRIVEESLRILKNKKLYQMVYPIFMRRQANRADLAEIRRLCADAEQFVKDERPPQSDLLVYVNKVRELYDDLHRGGTSRKVHLRIDARSENAIRWKLWRNERTDESLLQTIAIWQAMPQNVKDSTWYTRYSDPFDLDVFGVQQLWLEMEEYGWWRNGHADLQWQLSGRTAAEQRMSTDKGTEYIVELRNLSPVLRLLSFMHDLDQLEEKLFRAGK